MDGAWQIFEQLLGYKTMRMALITSVIRMEMDGHVNGRVLTMSDS